MVYRGHIEKGQVVLNDAVELPEGATVVVELLSGQCSKSLHPDIKRFTGIIPQGVDARSEHQEALEAKHA